MTALPQHRGAHARVARVSATNEQGSARSCHSALCMHGRALSRVIVCQRRAATERAHPRPLQRRCSIALLGGIAPLFSVHSTPALSTASPPPPRGLPVRCSARRLPSCPKGTLVQHWASWRAECGSRGGDTVQHAHGHAGNDAESVSTALETMRIAPAVAP